MFSNFVRRSGLCAEVFAIGSSVFELLSQKDRLTEFENFLKKIDKEYLVFFLKKKLIDFQTLHVTTWVQFLDRYQSTQ